MPTKTEATKQQTEPDAHPKSWEEFFRQTRAANAAGLILADLDDAERSFLATCQKIYRQEHSCETPFEQFFCGLVIPVEIGRLPTPDDVAHDLETFRNNWDDMKSASRKFLEAYPDEAA